MADPTHPDRRPASLRPSRVERLAGTGALALAAALIALAIPRETLAQHLRPWTPPFADSLQSWVAEAKARFQTNEGDSVGGANYRAYDLVGGAGRQLLRSLGRAGMTQAHVVAATLDSMGLDTEIALDPERPEFALLLVHNPFRRTASSVGYLYWFRDRELREQGIVFVSARHPQMKVWWYGAEEYPYAAGIVTENPVEGGMFDLVYLRLSYSGQFWALMQFPGHSPDLGGPGSAIWADLNHDGRPEVVTWSTTLTDSTFESCGDCPGLLTERTFAERELGFEPLESRLVPGPWATFTLFIRLLRDGNRTAAARLLADPARIPSVVSLGWGARRGRGTWKVEYAEPGQGWPRWLAMRFAGPNGPVRYIVHFTLKDGRWLIQDWVVPKPAPVRAGSSTG
jgi:hypothetical protein